MYKTIKEFYSSNAWKTCRNTFISCKSGLCERCLQKGLIVPAKEVHHKKRLTEANINDPSIALNFDNLEALCTACHEKEHEADARARKQKKPERYKVDNETGKVITKPDIHLIPLRFLLLPGSRISLMLLLMARST